MVPAIIGVLLALAMAVPSLAAAYTTTQLDPTTVGNRPVGKIFLDFPGSSGRCTGSVVNAPNRSPILTAGHCLSNLADGAVTEARFYPAFHDGTGPYGRWTSVKTVPAPQWGGTNYRYDYGFIVVARNASGVPIQDVVGAEPIAFNQTRSQNYRSLGYPQEPTPKYDGEHLWACDSAYAGDSATNGSTGPLQLSIGCDFGHASSGGPWFTAQGVVASVNSNSPAGSPEIERGPYLDSDAAALFNTVGNISTAPLAPPVVHKKKYKKKHHHRGAFAAKKMCKKKHHH